MTDTNGKARDDGDNMSRHNGKLCLCAKCEDHRIAAGDKCECCGSGDRHVRRRENVVRWHCAQCDIDFLVSGGALSELHCNCGAVISKPKAPVRDEVDIGPFEQFQTLHAGVDPWELAGAIVEAAYKARLRNPSNPPTTVVVPRDCIPHVQRFVDGLRKIAVIPVDIEVQYTPDQGNEKQVVFQFRKLEGTKS